jgi:hypothetical protein
MLRISKVKIDGNDYYMFKENGILCDPETKEIVGIQPTNASKLIITCSLMDMRNRNVYNRTFDYCMNSGELYDYFECNKIMGKFNKTNNTIEMSDKHLKAYDYRILYQTFDANFNYVFDYNTKKTVGYFDTIGETVYFDEDTTPTKVTVNKKKMRPSTKMDREIVNAYKTKRRNKKK